MYSLFIINIHQRDIYLSTFIKMDGFSLCMQGNYCICCGMYPSEFWSLKSIKNGIYLGVRPI